MSQSIDKRVVEMQFDNSRFEQNANQTLGTLGKLNNALKMEGASKGLQDVAKSAEGISFTGVESGVESLKQRFSSLGIVGMTVIQNLTTSVMGLAKSLASKTINLGITRAMNIEQARFMIEGLGADWEALSEDINNAVAGTAYGFDEAARAAAQFSASGVKAGNDMENALTGISGMAAMTGSSYSDISEIFTTVAGNGKLMTEQLRQFSFRGLNVAATLGKEMGKSEQEIRDMVSKGEISFEEFSAAMNKAFGDHAKEAGRTFTGALANVKAAMGRLGAAFITPIIQTGKSAEEFINLVDVLNAVRDVIDTFKKKLEDLGVFDKFTKGVETISKRLISFLQVFSEVSNKASRTTFAEKLQAKLGMNSKTAYNLSTTFKGLKAAVDIVWQAFKALFSALKPAGQATGNILDVFLSFTALIAKFVIKLDELIKKTGIFKGILVGTATILKGVTSVIKSVFTGIADGIGKIAGTGSGNISKVIEGITKPFENLSQIAPKIQIAFTKFSVGIARGVRQIFTGVGNIDFDALNGLFTSGFLATLTVGMKKLVDTLGNFKEIPESIKGGLGVLDNVKEVLGSVKDTLEAYQKQIKAEILVKIGIAIALLAGSILILSSIDPKKLASALAGMAILLTELYAAFVAFSKAMDKYGIKGIMRSASALLIFSAAILILTTSIKILSTMDFGEMLVGLGSLGILLKMLAKFSQEINKESKGIIKTSVAMVIFGAAINILATAVKRLGSLDIKTLGKGLGSVLILMGSIVGISKLIKDPKSMVGFSAGMLILAAALNVMSTAVSNFGGMDLKSLGKGLGSVLFLLMTFAGMSKLINPQSFILMATSIVIMAQAINMLVKPIQKLGKMTGDALVQGLLGVVSALSILAAAGAAMRTAIPGALAMIIMAGALMILTPALLSLSKLSLGQLAVMLGALAGVFLIFGAAAAILAPVVLPMIGLAGAIALLGAAVFLAGTGISAFAVGLTTLAASATVVLAAVPTMIEALVLAIEQFLIKIAEASPRLITAGMQILLNFLQGILENLPQIVETGMQIVINLLAGITEKLPDLINTGFQMIFAILDGISANLPTLVTKGVDVIVAFLQGISQNLGRVIDAGFKLAISFINGLATAIDNNSAQMGAAVGRLIVSAIKAVPKFLFGAIASIGGQLIKAGGMIKDKIKEGFTKGKEKIKEKGKEFVTWIKKGVESKTPDVFKSGKKAGQKGKEGAKEGSKGSKQIGIDMVKGLMSGIGSLAEDLKNKIKNLGGDALKKLKDKLGIKSPSREFMKVGKFAIEGFIIGIESLATNVDNSVRNVAGHAVNSMANAIGRINDSVNDNINSEPVIKPVLDLSNITSSNISLNPIGLNASVNQASSLNRALMDSNAKTEAQNEELLMSQLSMNEALNELVDVTKSEGLDPDRIYSAIRAGAEAATFKVIFNGREMKRELRNLGVSFK